MSCDITKLHPVLQGKLVALYALCKENNLKLGIQECLRTAEEQDFLYAQGRSKPGAIVTYAQGNEYKSQHQWGIAFDFYKNVKGHAYDDLSFFIQVGALAKSIGLGWGGDWVQLKDSCHLYLTDWGDDVSLLLAQYHTPEQFRKTWGKPVLRHRFAGIVVRSYLKSKKRLFVSRAKSCIRTKEARKK